MQGRHSKTEFGNKANRNVIIDSLPVFYGATEEKQLKRVLLEKGELAQIYNSVEPIHLIAYVSFPTETIRGGHYHLYRTENFYIIQGSMLLALQDLESQELIYIEVNSGDSVLIKPKIAHAIKAITEGHGIEFSQEQFSPENTIAYPFLIEQLKNKTSL